MGPLIDVETVEIILTHDNADFDAVAGLLAVHKLHPEAKPTLPGRLNRNVTDFIELYQDKLPFIPWNAIKVTKASHITLVDTQRLPAIKGLRSDVPVHIIDHHGLSYEPALNKTFTGEIVGAVTTLLTEQIQRADIALNSLEATLLLLGIYEDTGSLLYGTTTPRDLLASAWLLQQGAMLDTARKFLKPPLLPDQQNLLEALIPQTETRVIQGYTVSVSTVEADKFISEISAVTHHLRDMLASSALFVLVQMPKKLQLVARATDDAIDVGDIARLLGGGGHNRAAAANIRDKTVSECVQLIWHELEQRIQPVARIADLMSQGVQTVSPEQPLEKIIRHLRRIGHEGYPVIESDQVIGLLTRRDIDRALEHNLGNLMVHDVMIAGDVSLHPEDSVAALEQRLVESGWGQIPIVDETQKVIGIVTRTDLIKHWARLHPANTASEKWINAEQIEHILGQTVASLIQTIAHYAQTQNLSVYMIGGVVRDLLLQRPNFDIDFVVESNAIQLASDLATQFGGSKTGFTPFGTAKWKLDESVASALNLPADELPDHIDFASARNEFYEHPTALPTVYNSSIKLDLGRRDFTINTLAIQINPTFGRVLDNYGGLADLENKLIRVLHSLSFVDDPTRILRAFRFERRLGFAIEPRTAELINNALPMLGRITGERLRNELNLLLQETEPEKGLLKLQTEHILNAIHPAFQVDEGIIPAFQSVRSEKNPLSTEAVSTIDLYWNIIATCVDPAYLENFGERLLFGRSMIDSFLQTVRIINMAATLPDLRPSQIVLELENISELALMAAWYSLPDRKVRECLQKFWLEWRHIQPVTDGHKLRSTGLKPGPCYAVILNRLRTARLDGDIQTDSDEEFLLQKLIRDEKLCDDHT